MSDEEVTFEVPPSTRREARLAGWFGVGMAVVFAVLLFPEGPDAGLVIGLLLCLGFGASMLHYASKRAPGYSVIINRQGVRIGDGRLIAFSEIDQLRNASGRVELYGRGERLGVLSYGLDDLWGAVALIRRNIRFHLPSLQRQMVSPQTPLRLAGDALAIVALLVLGVWLIRGGSWSGYLIVAGTLWGFYETFCATIRRIEFNDSEVRLRYAIGGKSIPRSQIRFFDIVFFNEELYAAGSLGDETMVKLKLPGVDPFLIVETANRAYAGSVT